MTKSMDLKGKTNSAEARLPMSLVSSALVFSAAPSSSLKGTSSSSMKPTRLDWPK